MRPGGHSKSYFTGTIRLYDPDIAHALGVDAAAVFQHVHYLGLDSPDGWVAKPIRTFAAELGLTDHNAADRALDAVVDAGMVEKDDRQKVHRYRVSHDGATALFPQRVRTADRKGENSQGETEGLSHSETVIPPNSNAAAESPLAGAHARPDESREDQTRPGPDNTASSSLRSSSADGGGAAGVPVAREATSEDEQGNYVPVGQVRSLVGGLAAAKSLDNDSSQGKVRGGCAIHSTPLPGCRYCKAAT